MGAYRDVFLNDVGVVFKDTVKSLFPNFSQPGTQPGVGIKNGRPQKNPAR